MKKGKNIDELFREKLTNYEQEPPAWLLDSILVGAAQARRKKAIIYWRITGVAAALLLAFVAGWQFNTGNDQQLVQETVISQEITTEENNLPSAEKSVLQTEKETIRLASASQVSERKNTVSEADVAKTSSAKKITTPIETTFVASNSEMVRFSTIKSIHGRIYQQNQSAKKLQGEKTGAGAAENLDKSIDQQIMEHNQQLAMVRDENTRKTRWTVGAQVSPEYNVSRSSHSQVYASNMLGASSNPVDLGAGISVEYKKGKRWSVQSGIYYSGMGQTSGNSGFSNKNLSGLIVADANRGAEYFNAPVNIDPKSSQMSMNSIAGIINFDQIPAGMELAATPDEKAMVSNAVVVSDARFIQNFEYLEIPLYLRYTLIDSRFDVEMIGGFSSNFLVGNNAYIENNSGKNLIGSTKDMESLNYSGTLGVGLKYGLSKRFFLNVEPRIKYYLNSLNSNSAVTYKPYTVGVFTGLSYEF
jgi:hypothetical protein